VYQESLRNVGSVKSNSMIILYRIKGACDGCEMTIGITIISSIFVKLFFHSLS